jgi:HK97 family phage prohead protease
VAVDDVPRRDFARTWDTTDITVRSDGDGRTVQAYITPFGSATEIKDRDGHYQETIGRGAFTKTLAERGLNFAVLYNHGRTFDGRTDGALMVPIGVPRMLDQHDRGLYSETEYLDNPLAAAVLDGVKKGAIRGYSFTGTFMKSQRTAPASRGGLPTINRSEVAMREYGPVLFPAYADAAIIGTRAQSFLDELARLDPRDVDRLRQMLGVATPLGAGDTTATAPAAGEPAEHDPAPGQSPRLSLSKRSREILAALHQGATP